MNLIISLTNSDILPESLRTRRVEFGASGGVIGRHQDCDWVLDDPERFVSSRHMNIVFKKEVFYVEDISTNGTYLNEQLIGKGNKLPLVTGDVLRLGRFILSVEQRDKSGATIDEMGASVSGKDLLSDTSHGADSDILDTVGKSDDLLADPEDTEDIDGYIGDGFVASDDADGLLGDVAPLPAVQDALPVLRQSETSEAVPSDWMTKGEPAKLAEKASISDDLLSGSGEPTGAMDDYGLTPVPPVEDPEPVKKKAVKKAAPKKPKAKKSVSKKAAVKKPTVKKPAVKKTAAKKPTAKKTIKKPAKKSVAAKSAVAASAAAIAAPAMMKKDAAEALTAAEPAETVKAPIAAPQYSEPLSEDFGTALASALLLNPMQATGETGDVLGNVMRELIEGSLDLMQTRNQMRQELRLGGTMVGARANNPLKFSINYQDALGRMLQGEAMGFKPAVESTREVVDDLKRHQLGVLAGIDAGVKALLDALDPKKIGGGKAVIAGLSMTSKMAEHHARIKEDTLERSDGVFWRAFTEAYKMAVAQSYER